MKKALIFVLGITVAFFATAQQSSTPDQKPDGNTNKRQASSPQKPPAPAAKKPQQKPAKTDPAKTDPAKTDPAKTDAKAAQAPSGVSSSTSNAAVAAERKDEERTADSPQSTVGQVESLKKKPAKKSSKKPAETQPASDAKPQ